MAPSDQRPRIPLRCKCGHPMTAHRDGFEWNEYGRGICHACETCPVYRPHRVVTR